MRLGMNIEEVGEIEMAAVLDARIFVTDFPGEHLTAEDSWEARAWSAAQAFIENRIRHPLPVKAHALYHKLLTQAVEATRDPYDDEPFTRGRGREIEKV